MSMTEFKIEADVPIPTRRTPLSRIPWLSLKVGDSFVHPGPSKLARSAASWAGKRHGRMYCTRTLADGTVRVWRVE